MDIRPGEATLSNLFSPPSEKGSALKGKNLLPKGANSFFLEQTPFQKGLGVKESKQEIENVKYRRKNTKCIRQEN